MSEFFIEWTREVRATNQEYVALAEDPENVALVREHVRRGLRRTLDFPVTCGGQATGLAVSARVRADRIELQYRSDTHDALGMQHSEAVAQDVTMTCPVCGVRQKRGPVYMLTSTLAAMRSTPHSGTSQGAGRSELRAGVRFH